MSILLEFLKLLTVLHQKVPRELLPRPSLALHCHSTTWWPLAACQNKTCFFPQLAPDGDLISIHSLIPLLFQMENLRYSGNLKTQIPGLGLGFRWALGLLLSLGSVIAWVL